jgi:hypothetical protein
MTLTDPKSMIRVAREAGGEAHVEPLNLGERVRELRRSLGWTLEEAASPGGPGAVDTVEDRERADEPDL